MKRIALAVAMLFCGFQQAQAGFVSISAAGAGPLSLAPSATAVELVAENTGYNVVDNTPTVVFLQNALITIGNSGSLNTVINFAQAQMITINGDTQAVSFGGTATITPTLDTFVLDESAVLVFDGNVLFKVLGGAISFNQFGTFAVELFAEITFDNVNVGVVPEPASIAMWGFGALGLTLAARRKSRKTESAC